MCAMLFPVWKQSLTSFLIILALQNYQCSRLDVDWAAKQKMMRAGWIARLYSKITRPFSVQNSPKLLEMSAMFFFSFFQIQFHVLPENCSCPKLLDLPTWRKISALQARHQVHALLRSLKHSRAQRKMQRVGWIARLYSGITVPSSIQNSPKLLEMSSMLFSVCKLRLKGFSGNSCPSKLPAFKVRRPLGFIQSASELNNSFIPCCRESRVPLLSQIIPQFGPNRGQMLLFPLQKSRLHKIKTRFAHLQDDFCLAAPHQVHRPTVLP